MTVISSADIQVLADDLSGKPIQQLLIRHLNGMHEHSPEDSVHALDLDGLKESNVSFWSGWIDGELAGCGAFKILDRDNIEIKSMRTHDQFLRQGVAARILEHMLKVAKDQGFKTAWLETGSPEPFWPAQRMYERFGFKFCGPFADYRDDPFSVFMTKKL